MKSERSDTEKNNQIEEGKGIGIDKVINIMCLLIRIQSYKTILSYCLKCKKNTENINLVSKSSNNKTMLLCNHNLLYVVVKTQDL